MGHDPDCFDGSNQSENIRLGITSKSMDLHAVVGLLILTRELEGRKTTCANNMSVHFTQVDTPYHTQLCDFRRLDSRQYVLGQGQDRKPMPWAKRITQGLRDVTSKELIKPMIPVPNMDRNNPNRGLGFPVSDAPISARSRKANARKRKKKIICEDLPIGDDNCCVSAFNSQWQEQWHHTIPGPKTQTTSQTA